MPPPDHNKNFQPIDRWRRSYEGDIVADAVQRQVMRAIANPALTPGTRLCLKNIMASKDRERFKSLSEINAKTRLSFIDKLDFTKMCTQQLYFRKMSAAEFADLDANHKTKPLNAALKFKNADLYRVWLSSSVAMCLRFHNELATTAGDVIVKFVVSGKPVLDIKCAPHQQQGVQNNKNAIAVHRETFAHVASFDMGDLTYVRDNRLDHNIGFTLASCSVFHDVFVRYERVT